MQDISISISPSYGDPDLYVVVNGTALPSYSNYAYKSASSTGADVVVVSHLGVGCHYSDLSLCFCSGCFITIAVIPFSTRSTYVLSL